MSGKSFDEYQTELENKYLNEEQWDALRDAKNVTLLLGAGVTSCLVGNWNELLNELAVDKSASDGSCIKPQEMLRYLSDNCGGKLLADDISVLEKGEYVRYSEKDQKIYQNGAEAEHWKETIFAARVLTAVKRLIKRHLCDGAGRAFVCNFRDDFLCWCRNEPVTSFRIGRRILASNLKTEEELKKLTSRQIVENLNRFYGLSINLEHMEEQIPVVEADTTLKQWEEKRHAFIDSVCSMFSSLYWSMSEASFRRKIRDILENSDLKMKSSSEKTRLFLIKLAAFLLWRPDYRTLEATLSLCVNRKITRVINYNFDTIFDRLLNDVEVQKALRKSSANKDPLKVCVFGMTGTKPVGLKGFCRSADDDAVHICHVHGLADQDTDSTQTVIFSEASYFSYQKLSLNPGSIKIAEASYAGHLLCVGFSGADTNFRSILRQLNLFKKDPVFFADNEHKIFLTRTLKEITNYYGIQEKMPIENLHPAFLCASANLDMQQTYYRDAHKVTVLWAKEFPTLAEKLENAFEKA